MEIMNAATARAKTTEAIDTYVNKQFDEVKQRIIRAIEGGEYHCVIMGELPSAIISTLKANGYILSKYLDATYDPPRHGVKIEWGD